MSLRYKSMADLPPMHRNGGYVGGYEAPVVDRAKPGKYRNQPTIEDGQRFDSKLEARCYRELKLRQAAGEVLWFIRQPVFVLEGDVRYRADFLAILAGGGVEVIDAKGFVSQACANKLKQVKARYGFTVLLWHG